MKIDGYLTEQKLLPVLEANFDSILTQVRVEKTRKRWDYVCKKNDETYVVEFDGSRHYMFSLVIKSDMEKDEIATKLGYKIVRIPYFIQLTNETFEYFFGFKTKEHIEQDFPHGFIASKDFPASFCPLGLIRYHDEVNNKLVQQDIFKSLDDRAKEYGRQFVIA